MVNFPLFLNDDHVMSVLTEDQNPYIKLSRKKRSIFSFTDSRSSKTQHLTPSRKRYHVPKTFSMLREVLPLA